MPFKNVHYVHRSTRIYASLPGNTVFWLTLAYFVVIVYSSLHPLESLRFSAQPPWRFLFRPMTLVGVTTFDTWLNIIAYTPLGFGLVWLFQPAQPALAKLAWLAWLLRLLGATSLAGLVSVVLEGIQIYSAMRVASNWDVLTNTAGAALGASLACVVLAVNHGNRWRGITRTLPRLIAPQRGAIWAVLGLWALAQLHPQGWAFMTAPLSGLISPWLPTSVQTMALPSEQLLNLEIVATTIAVSGVLALLRLGMNPQLRLLGRAVFMGVGLVLIVLWQVGAYTAQYGPGQWRGLMSWGVIDAMLPLACAWLLLVVMPSFVILVLAVALLALHCALAQILPPHPYMSSAVLWQQGRFIHLYGLTHLVSALWPILALAALVLQSRYRHYATQAFH